MIKKGERDTGSHERAHLLLFYFNRGRAIYNKNESHAVSFYLNKRY